MPTEPLKPKGILPEGMKLKVEPKTPPLGTSTGARRGRPMGFKPQPKKLTWAEFEKDPLTKFMDDFLKNSINATLLKDHTQKIEQTKVGGALMYTVYYYTSFKPDHPLMILAMAMAGTAIEVSKCMASPKIAPQVKREGVPSGP